MKHIIKKLLKIIPVLLFLSMFYVSPVHAEDGGNMDQSIIDVTTDLNTLWTLLAGFLVFFMQAGFALVETGFTRKRNVVHTMLMNLMVFCAGAVGYWLTGFALQFGGINYSYPATGFSTEWSFAPTTLSSWTANALSHPLLLGGQNIAGLSGWMLKGLGASSGILAFFVFQMVFMDTAATIPTGSMAERLKFVGFIIMSLWVSMFIYPVAAGWVWGGGWLANLGRTLGLGNGAVDFAGSGCVHTIGGLVGLTGAMVIGPRLGKFNKDGSANTIPGHNIALGILGTIILFFGWFGFNPGSSLSFSGAGRNLAVVSAVNTLLAGAAGGCAAMAYMWLISKIKKPDPGYSVNGILAGLVAITAPCAFVDPWAAVVIGLIAGVWVCIAGNLLEKLKIDDPVGAVPVHLGNGLLGVLCVGLFANGNADTAGWNGIASPVTGLFYGGGWGQLGAQAIEAVALIIFVGGLSFLFFKLLKKLKLLRVSEKIEREGLDVPEMGSIGYPEDWEPAPEAIIYSTK